MTAQFTAILPRLAEGRKKKWSYSSLLFSLFYFFPVLQAGAVSPSFIIASGGIYLLFLITYLAAVRSRHSHIVPYCVALLVVAVIASLLQVGGTIIFSFVAFICGYYFTPRVGMLVCGLIGVFLFTLQFTYYNSAVWLVVTIYTNTWVLFGFGVMERRETLHQLSAAQAAQSVESLTAIAERERIGRDLHDIAGHALSSISLKAQVAARLLEKDRIADAKTEVAELASLSQSLLSEIRQTVSGMRHLTLEEEIDKALAKLRQADINVHKSVDSDVFAALSPFQQTQLALITKEAVTNILRHSNGDTVLYGLKNRNGQLVLSIADNGQASMPVAGNGLTGIRERADNLNAAVTLTTGDETRLEVILPSGAHTA